jgi:hypothetical protein
MRRSGTAAPSDRLTDVQRGYNRLQAGLRALVGQSIAHLAGAWALRRWRGLLYRIRDVFRAAQSWAKRLRNSGKAVAGITVGCGQFGVGPVGDDGQHARRMRKVGRGL